MISKILTSTVTLRGFSFSRRNVRDEVLAQRIRNRILKSRTRIDGSVPLTDVRFVVMDTETTGMDPGAGDEIIAVGAVAVRNCEVCVDEVFDRLVNPGRSIPPEIVELTGISEEMVAGAGDFWSVLEDFLDFIGDSVLVGHWIHFDLAFINSKLRHYCNVKFEPYRYDTNVISKAINPKARSHTLDNILRWHGIEPVGRHTALGDALLTARIFVNFLHYMLGRNIRTLGEMNGFIKYNFNCYSYFVFPFF